MVCCAQAAPQWPQLNFDVAALLAREFRAAVDKARAQRLAAVHARLQGAAAARGFHAVRARLQCCAGCELGFPCRVGWRALLVLCAGARRLTCLSLWRALTPACAGKSRDA